MPEALPAVTVPSLVKAGRSFAMLSAEASWRIYSSSLTTTSPLRVVSVTGVISSLNFPAFCAAAAFCCEARASASWSARVICQAFATFSAVMPIW